MGKEPGVGGALIEVGAAKRRGMMPSEFVFMVAQMAPDGDTPDDEIYVPLNEYNDLLSKHERLLVAAKDIEPAIKILNGMRPDAVGPGQMLIAWCAVFAAVDSLKAAIEEE